MLRSDVGWTTQFASLRYLLPIDQYVSKSDLSDYLPSALNYDKYNGHLYGLPQITNFLALMYNKAILTKTSITTPPTTMDQFEADAIKIVQTKSREVRFRDFGTSYFTLPFLWAFGGGMVDIDGKTILVNNSGSVAGLTFLLKLQTRIKSCPVQG